MLTKYYFKIKHIKGINNVKANTLIEKPKLQGSIKLLKAILRINKNGKIRYNHLKLIIVYKVLKLY